VHGQIKAESSVAELEPHHITVYEPDQCIAASPPKERAPIPDRIFFPGLIFQFMFTRTTICIVASFSDAGVT
jgi:hypothetical protein